MANPFKRLAGIAKGAVGAVSGMFAARPPYLLEKANFKVDYTPRMGRNLGRWSVGWWQSRDQVNGRDIYNLAAKSGSYQDGYSIVITGRLEEDYPTKIGEDVVTLSVRVHKSVLDNALRNTDNRSGLDIINQVAYMSLGVRWTDIYEVSILDR